MVEELAVNAVEKKLDMQASILVGNYEYYYACGKLKGLMDLAVDLVGITRSLTPPVARKKVVVMPSATRRPNCERQRMAMA